ncbi:Nramp family divalent metal transporter [Bordetella genomosp. 12]|uniref:Manganese transporter n=1 Tax=Bordetella genomosp. 12 TaxID=463035 RepID=A0A261VC67_9BORD|nr:Nramp family divalent metal transporter [Bordetella genomosp. 12]OZI70743.1 manganese transporter [Bordetella genomosp. 12]
MTRLLLALSGPAARHPGLRRVIGSGVLVAVGYIDPGNWATDIAGGAGFGYGLLAVVFAAALLAMGFQILVARLALATGQDLAALTTRYLPRSVANAAWLAGEAAILATALAELIGGAIALRLLFGLPLLAGIAVTGIATLTVFYVARGQVQRHEQIIAALLGIVALSFVILLAKARPDLMAITDGVAHTAHALADPRGFMIALGILGATLMPHNLYLHSGELAQRAQGLPPGLRGIAFRLARQDTVISLSLAMLVNAAIMIVAAASLAGQGPVVANLDAAHAAIAQSLGAGAALLFALALYASGQSSTITGVMAGKILSRGFERGKQVSASRRALMTRVAAGLAAAAMLLTGGSAHPDSILVLSQVILSLALPFALIPLVLLACRSDVMGRWKLSAGWAAAALCCSVGIVILDAYLLADMMV